MARNSASHFLLRFIAVSHLTFIGLLCFFSACLIHCAPFPSACSFAAATSYYVKPGRPTFLLFLSSYIPTMSHEFLPLTRWSLIRNDLGSCFPFRETNSSRPGSNLWGLGESLAPS